MSLSILSPNWNNKLPENFFNFPEIQNLFSFLKERKKVVNVFPETFNVFKSFNLVSPEKIKVILCLQDPYHKPGIADGLCMSCSNSKTPQPTLRFFLNQIKETVSNAKNRNTFSLEDLAEQGVLLLNRTLTVEQGSPNSHLGKWDFFQNEIFKIIKKQKQPIVYILLGKDALWFTQFIQSKDLLLFTSHPAAAVYSGGKWDCQDIFNKCNEFLKKNKIEEILW